MLSSSGTVGCAAIRRKVFVSGSLIPAMATVFVGSAPTSVARFEAPWVSTAILMNSHAPVLFFAFFGITQLWKELAAVRPGCGPDWGSGASARSLPSACSNALITNGRSEEHTSELQSRRDLVCRLLLEKKKKTHFSEFPQSRQINIHSRE